MYEPILKDFILNLKKLGGGADGARTRDLKRELLYQLS